MPLLFIHCEKLPEGYFPCPRLHIESALADGEKEEEQACHSKACCDLIKSTIKWIPFVTSSMSIHTATPAISFPSSSVESRALFSSADIHLQSLLVPIPEQIILYNSSWHGIHATAAINSLR